MKRDPKSLWYAIEQEMGTFETGSGGSGFYALPSGHPITHRAAARKLARIANWAEEASQKLSAEPKGTVE